MEENDNHVGFIEFKIADRYFAIDLANVKEIIETPSMRKLPNTKEWIKGVVSLRDDIVTVIDISKKLGILNRKDNYSSLIILDEASVGLKIGILVDYVIAVSYYDCNDIVSNVANFNSEILLGVVNKEIEGEKKIFALLDAYKLIRG